MARTYRGCVVYRKGFIEHQTAWYSDADRAQRALAIIRRRYGAANAVIYRD